MRQIILLFILLISVFGYSQDIKNILFIGNSYTASNNLPSIVDVLAKSAGDEIIFETSTGGGQTLQNHSNSAATISKIQQANWDYVVLQEQSQLPSFPMSQVQVQVFPYAKILCDTIRYYNNCTTPMFFMTWGRENGDASNCASWPPVCTYTGMDSLLNLRYRMMADSNEALVSPVGAVWNYIRNQYPTIDLYSSDGSHPSLEGSYAAACTFYTMIFQKSPLLITNDYGLNHMDADNIRNAAKIIAYDSLSKWNINKFNPQADFVVTNIGDSIFTANNSKFAHSYLWSFGDGTTSTLFEPTHKYSNAQTYTISLSANKCDMENVMDTSLSITINNMELMETNGISVFPNPAKEYFIIKFDNITHARDIILYSIDGRIIKEFKSINAHESTFDISDLDAGIYMLSLRIKDKEFKLKIIK